MSVFADIPLSWRDKDYVVKADSVLRLIAAIEEIVTIGQLAEMQSKNAPKFAKIASAFGAALRFAGANVTDEEVFEGMFSDEQNATNAITALRLLVVIMVPPRKESGGKNGPAKEPQKGKSRPTAAPSKLSISS